MTLRKAGIAALLALAMVPGKTVAQASPGTDIWAFRMTGETPTVDLASTIRVTERPGYDNQPHIAPGERLVLYTAIDSAGQADIWSFDLNSGSRANITRSAPESEYSAIIMPSRTRFSAIRVEADSTQRLWSFESGGTNPEVVLTDVAPVGYHAWLTEDTLALFVLGNPATLQIASVREGSAQVVAENIGRSIYRIPGRQTASFVQWDADGSGWINEFDPEGGEAVPIAPLLEQNEFYAWTPGGLLVMGQGSKLFQWVPGESTAWEEIADLEPIGIHSISRIAISSEGGWIAVVATDTQ
jgi:hypothetical protein